jgi:chemotaxis protein histidine kinase CheA
VERTLGATFHRILKDGQIANVMVIFEDQTDILAAKSSLEKERRLHESEIETISVILRTGPRTLREFIEESRSTLLETRSSLPALANDEVMNRCFRGLHSLKGSAASLGFTMIAEQAHALEDVLSRIRDRKSSVTQSVKQELETGIQEIFSGFDLVQRLTKGFLEFSQMEQPSDTESAMARQEEFLESLRTMVSDLGRQLEKKVVLRVNNSLREMPFLAKMKNPLIHLVRNAVDHGIEDVYQRLTEAKQEEGTVSLRMFVQDHHYVLEVSDDGGGLDLERIRKKAQERNLLPPGDQEVSQSQLLSVLFSPGFSTLDSATAISGRGVGLDVVRDAVRSLKGSISVSTKKAKGTRFTLRIPQARASRPT